MIKYEILKFINSKYNLCCFLSEANPFHVAYIKDKLRLFIRSNILPQHINISFASLHQMRLKELS